MSDALAIAAEAEAGDAAAAVLPSGETGGAAAVEISATPAADAPADDPEAPSANIDPGVARRRRGTLILAVAGGLFCALGLAAGAGAAIIGARPAQVELAVNTPVSFYALPDVIATLAAEGQRARRVRIAVTFEVEDANLAQLKAQAAVIVAATQEHLLDLRPADLAGRNGAENLRAFIREVVDARTAPGIVRNIFFTSFVVG